MYENISVPPEVDCHSRYGGDMSDKYDTFVSYIKSIGFTGVGSGSFRYGYVRNKIIIKVPVNGDGVIDNIVEAIAWRQYKNKPTNRYIYLAPCRLLPNHCLIMMKVEIRYINGEPWTRNLLDQQYGLLRNKQVAYDYAFEVTERNKIEKDLGIESDFWNRSSFKNLMGYDQIYNPAK